MTSKTASNQPAQHYYALDFVRAIAAVAVIFWHYQHFFMAHPGDEVSAATRVLSPLYGLFRPFYDYGYVAVQVFWILSGFVFAAVYFNRSITAGSFFWARFARLYPLHFVTLMLVALLQQISSIMFGEPQIYANNDIYHFGLQILLVSGWGWEVSQSFNGPIWSVSVEILIYMAFFAFLPLLSRSKFNHAMFMALACWSLVSFLPSEIHVAWTCGFYFFAGVAVYRQYEKICRRPLLTIMISACVLATGVAAFIYIPQFDRIIAIPSISLGLLGLTLGFENTSLKDAFRHCRKFGDLTYGIYLWHVPIQILLIFFIKYYDRHDIIYSPVFLLIFITAVVFTSAMSFKYFERPVRENLNSLYMQQGRLKIATRK